MQFLPASLLNNGGKKKKKKKTGEMGRKMKRKSQKHLLQRDAFHPSQAARRKEHRHIQTFFSSPSSLCLSHPFSSAAETPPDTWGQPCCITSSIASLEQQSHFFFSFQSIDIIPSAPFSPITLCYVMTIRGISAVPWLGLREECRGLGRCCRAMCAIWS